MLSILRTTLTYALCFLLIARMLTHAAARDGSISLQVFANSNCSTPYDSGLFDLHSYATPDTSQWYCNNQVDSAVVPPHWSQLKAFCLQAQHNYISFQVDWYEGTRDCSGPALTDNITYRLGWTSSTPTTIELVNGVCQPQLTTLDHFAGGESSVPVYFRVNCTFSSDASSRFYTPTARWTMMVAAVISALLTSAVMSGGVAEW